MARTTLSTARRGRKLIIPPALTLAFWQIGRTWRLLLMVGLGMLAAVTLVSAVPLFSRVATSAGLRGALVGDPNGSGIAVSVGTASLGQDVRQPVQQALTALVQRDIGPYVSGDPQSSAQTPHLPITSVAGKPNTAQDTMSILGLDPAAAQNHLIMEQGVFPSPDSGSLDIAITAATAQMLDIRVGQTLMLGTSTTAPTLTIRVVGIVATNHSTGPFWNNVFLDPQQIGPIGYGFTVVANQSALLASAASLMPVGLQPTNNNTYTGEPAIFTWSYNLDLQRVTANNLDDLTNRLLNLQVDSNNTLGSLANVRFVEAQSGLDALEQFKSRIFVLQVPVTLLLLQVLALVIFFVSLVADLLIERQTDAISVLRSRGATRGQLFGALACQTGGIAIVTAVAGPLLAIIGTRYTLSLALAAGDQGALNTLDGNMFITAWGLRWYVLIALVGAIVTTLIAINRALTLDVLALRRETARVTRRPLWQRLNLDIVFAIIGITGYTLYVISEQRVPQQYIQALSPLSLIAPFFLLIAFVLLFVRVFPLLLRLGAWLTARGPSAAPMLALAGMSRTPRHAQRMTLLLALTTAFAIFTFVFVASQQQHTRDVADFTVGADFSGTLPVASTTNPPTPGALESAYAAIPGVVSATIGYQETIEPSSIQSPVQVTLNAVNADTYAATSVWNATNSTQSIGSLMQTLADGRASVLAQDTVPAIVDDAMWQSLRLASDPHFTLVSTGGGSAATTIHLLAVTHVTNLPGIFDGSNYGIGAGVMVDFSSYASVFAHDSGTPLAPSMIWLRTRDDAASLQSVRTALKSGTLMVTNLEDRRGIIANAASDPLIIDLLGTLAIGALTASLLGILGVLVASWLSVRNRLTNFAVLRALGGNRSQLTRILLWEHSIIYLSALVLGLAFGASLAEAVLPTLVFTNLLARTNFFVGNTNVPPIHTVVPYATLGAVLGGVVLLFLAALAIMTRLIMRPAFSQTLRLNED